MPDYDAIPVKWLAKFVDINYTTFATKHQVGTRGIICAEEARLKTMIALESRLVDESYFHVGIIHGTWK